MSADREMQKLVDHYGLAELERHFGYLLDYSEREARRTIHAIPDGVYRYIDYLDDDGVTFGRPVPIHVAIEVRGEELTVDFEGTSPQVRGAINATLSFAKSAVYFAVRSIMDSDAPSNAGFYRPITVKAPAGSLVNPNSPSAVAARGVSGFRVIDAMFGALAQAVPERVRAAGEGGTTSYSVASYDATGQLVLFREAIMGAWGAGFNREGIDGVANPACNISNAPVELVENQVPVRIERYELVPDSGGAGMWRGGMSIERQLCFLDKTVTIQLRSDRHDHPPYGLHEGKPGSGSANLLDDGDGWKPLPTKFIRTLKCGDRIRHRTAGGGGYGHPFDRPTERVLDDVSNGKVTVERAGTDYGVCILTNPFRIDEEATVRLRRNRLSLLSQVSA
jgi:N-methylhydantoinase B